MSEIPRPLLGITGPRAAGKDEAAIFFRMKGLLIVSLGDILREEAKSQNKDNSRETLIEVGKQLRIKKPAVLIEHAVEQWKNQRNKYMAGLAITGHFTPGECLAIQSHKGTIVYVDANQNIRYDREVMRGRVDSPKNRNDFNIQENIEMNGLAGDDTPNFTFTQELQGVVKIENNGTLEDFTRELEKLLL